MTNSRIGRVLRDRYRLLEMVGQGGGGAVYRADDLRLEGRITAVKEILPDPGAGEDVRAEMRQQFQREASTLARLDHPALPKVSDYFEHEGAEYLVMDFVDGPDLHQVLREARAGGSLLDEQKVLSWMMELLGAVAYLHGQDPPVLHRDIKPANIKLVSGDPDRIKLVDFGLVKPLDPSDPRTLTVARGVGSMPYTPLEQYAGDTGHTDARTDIYAVGATLYHLLTGQAPATAQDRFLMPNALQRPRTLNPELSSRLEAVVLQAMALHPEKRPADVNVLRGLLAGEADVSADVELGTASSAWRQGMWDNAGLLALVVLLLVLTVLATWRATGEDAPPAASEDTAALPAATATRFDAQDRTKLVGRRDRATPDDRPQHGAQHRRNHG